MKQILQMTLTAVLTLAGLAAAANAQTKPVVLEGDELKRVVPTSFYYAGQSAETQMRNAAAAKFSENHYLIVGLVDTSGYSTEISGVYEGFLIIDAPVTIGKQKLATGAYGFGFSKDAINIFDLGTKKILSVPTTLDNEMKRPRPVMIVGEDKSVRLYKGKSYVSIAPGKSSAKGGGSK